MQIPSPLVVVPVLLGMALLALGVVLGVVRSRRRARWSHVRGTVVGWRHRGAGVEGRTSVPQVAFATAEGRQVTAALGYGVDVGVYPTGREVDVWYDPADPERVQADVMGTGAVPYVLVLLGVAVGGVGVMLGSGGL